MQEKPPTGLPANEQSPTGRQPTGKPRLVIVGSGGHAKVIFDLLGPDYEVVGCTTRSSTVEKSRLPVLGDDSVLPEVLQNGTSTAFVAIGDNVIRRSLSLRLRTMGFQLANAVSSYAVLSPSVQIGSGVAIMPGAVVNADAQLQDDVIVNTGATVDHDCVLAHGSHVAPGCHLGGNVTVMERAFLGVGVNVIPGVRIGENAVVGAGATVIRDVPPSTVVMGVPARVVRIL